MLKIGKIVELKLGGSFGPGQFLLGGWQKKFLKNIARQSLNLRTKFWCLEMIKILITKIPRPEGLRDWRQHKKIENCLVWGWQKDLLKLKIDKLATFENC